MRYSVQQTVLNLVSDALFQTGRRIPASEAEKPSEADIIPDSSDEEFWKDVLSECRYQSVLALAAESLPNPAVVNVAYKNIYQKWMRLYDSCLVQNIRIFDAHQKIAQLMKENGIPYVILKGCASASYYPNPYVRSMGDVDFLVSTENLEKAQKALADAGYECTSKLKKEHHHIAYQKDGVHIELHFGLNGIPDDAVGNIAKMHLLDVIEKAQHERKTGMVLPDDFHHGLIILLHNAHHMTRSGMGLRHLCDWAVFVNHMGDGFPEMFEKSLKEMGMWEYANIMTSVCTFALGLPTQEWCKTYPEDLLKKVLDDIYGNGNFGRKSKDSYGSLFLQDTNERIEDAGYARRLISNLNRITRSYWPIAKKIVVLYPIGWIFFTARYGVRVLLGKRKKIDVTKTLGSAYHRNNLYREFHLFEIRDGENDGGTDIA